MADTTRPGYKNRNGQVVIRESGLPGTYHQQFIYQIACIECGFNYGANGSDITDSKCPKCQSGRAVLQYEEIPELE
jgi:hypothetical protein